MIAAGGGDPDPQCNPCSTGHPVIPQIAASKVSNPASGTQVLAGDTITYTVTLVVSNGPTTAPVVLTDTLDADLTFGSVTNNPGGFTPGGAGNTRTFTLAIGAASGTYVVEYTATVNADATGTVGNSVIAAGGGDPDPQCSPCSTGHPVIPQIAASKTSNPANGATVAANSTITYTLSLVVSNGPTTAPVVLTDTLNSNLTFGTVTSNPGGFTPGGAGNTRTFTLATGAASGTYVVEYTATVNANATGSVGNAVVATGGGDPNPVCTPCTTTHPLGPPVLSVAKTLTGESITVNGIAQPGENLTYTIVVTNTGGSIANNTIVNELVPANTTFVGGTPTWTCAAGAPAGTACNTTLTVPAPLAGNPGTASATFTVRVVDPIPEGVLSIANAVAINDLPPPNCSSLPTPPACVVTPTMNLRLSKSVVGLSTTGPNAFNIAFRIQVRNVGGSVGSYTVLDTLGFPTGVSFNGPAQVTTTGGTINPIFVGGQYNPVNNAPQQLSASNVSLAIGATHEYTITIPIAVVAGGPANGVCNGTPGNGLYNGVTIIGSQQLNDDACQNIENDEARIRLVKTVQLGVDNNGNNYGDVGDVLHFDFVISNTGPSPLTSVRLLDPRVSDLACSPVTNADRPLRVLYADDVFRSPFEPLGSIALLPGDSIVCAATHTLTAADVAARRFDNTATASGVGPQGQVVSSVSTAIFTSFQ
ncbi:MAG: hypothetical protein OMOMHJEC_01656 [Xanthomonadales bacterium]|nr:hypothetical protein [Xanthomonadales bacterium]